MQVSLNESLKGVRVADVMTRDCPTVDGWLNLQNFVDEHLLRTGQRCFVVQEKGAVTGLVTPHEVKQVERARWPYVTLHDVMRPIEDLHALSPDAPLANALEMMGRYDLNQLPVMSDHHLDGVLSRAHVLGYLQNRMELHK